ncbi:unnamed protein product [Symbiodinium microadriaticum]|nr:unnamed protein product [Symbiodinium microadriaticum]
MSETCRAGSDVRQVLSSTVRRSATPPTVALMAGLPCHYGEAGKVRDNTPNEPESLSDSDYCRGDGGRTAIESDKQIESETSRPQLCDPSGQTPHVPDELAVSQTSNGMQGSDIKQVCSEDAETQVVRTENEQLSVEVEEAQDQNCHGEGFSDADRAADAQGTRAEPLDFLQLSKTQLNQSGGGQATASMSRDHFESDDPLVTQLWVDCKSLRQEMTELLEIVQRTCKRCRVAPANLTDLTPRSRGMSHKSELRKLVEALCQAHEAAVAGAEITDSQIQRASSPECSRRRQSSAPARSGRSGQRRPSETVELTREVEYLREKLQAAEAREAALSGRCTAPNESFLEPRCEGEGGAPERAPEPELTKATPDSVLQISGDEGQVKPMKQALDKVNVKVSRASSWASLDSGAQLLQMALDKKAEVAQLEVLSENTPPGSEEWIQAATQLAAAREELRLLGPHRSGAYAVIDVTFGSAAGHIPTDSPGSPRPVQEVNFNTKASQHQLALMCREPALCAQRFFGYECDQFAPSFKVFIRRHRGGSSSDKKGRQPQQGGSNQRHSHSPPAVQQVPPS